MVICHNNIYSHLNVYYWHFKTFSFICKVVKIYKSYNKIKYTKISRYTVCQVLIQLPHRPTPQIINKTNFLLMSQPTANANTYSRMYFVLQYSLEPRQRKIPRDGPRGGVRWVQMNLLTPPPPPPLREML